MANIYVVGEENSFTWLASRKRFGAKHKLITGGHQQELLGKLSVRRKGRIAEPAVVPIWNSNFGTIVLHSRTQEDLTAGTLRGEAGKIVDLWGERINFGLGVVGSTLAKDGTVYSVTVAKYQCSDFLASNKGIRFAGGYTTTTDACRAFNDKKRTGDGLLCSEELLKKHRIRIIEEDVANPFNYTVFFGLNKYPAKTKYLPRMSLGCFLMDLQGQDELPTDFISHWNEITKSKDVISAKDMLQATPKIIFILRYDESKVLALIEMPIRKGLDDPWVAISGDSEVELLGQVGLLNKSFSDETSRLLNEFLDGDGNRKAVFYGRQYDDGGKKTRNYFWICPKLKITVHGFEPELVKNCARLQVECLSNFLKEGRDFSLDAKAVLGEFDKDNAALKLAADSKPDLK
ncbi:MAG: prephenate dehydratase domain-containing protein [Candidatus Omnitrophota bacterium]